MIQISNNRRSLRQFFTPEPVVASIYSMLAVYLPEHPQILDPACGDGAFLRYACARQLCSRDDVWGCEIDGSLVAQLQHDGFEHVVHGDALEDNPFADQQFDLVIGNPPYGMLSSEEQGVQTSEVRFLERALQLVRPNGYIALVLPNGIFANGSLQPLREMLLSNYTILSIVALPRKTFRATGTMASCTLLLLQARPAALHHQILFAICRDPRELAGISAAFEGMYQLQTAHTDDDDMEHQLGYTCAFWMPQSVSLSLRMDPQFWHPIFRSLEDRLAAQHRLLSLADVLGSHGLIGGDHVRPSRGEQRGAGLPYEYYQTRQFLSTAYNYVDMEYCDEQAYERLQQSQVLQNDILLSCAGLGGAGRGRVCFVAHHPKRSCTGDVLIVRSEQMNPACLFLFFGSRYGRAQLLRWQNGVGTPNLSVREVLQLRVPVFSPSLESQLAQRYKSVTQVHHQAMGALRQRDIVSYAQYLRCAEGLLFQAQQSLEFAIADQPLDVPELA
jgi:predicted RNA methylase